LTVKKNELKISVIFWSLIFFFGSLLSGQKYPFGSEKLGSYFRIVVSEEDTTGLQAAISQSYALVDQLNLIFSDYLAYSECQKLSKAEAHQWIEISEDMFQVLKEAQKACKISKGAFNVTIGTVTALWRSEFDGHERERKIDSLLQCVTCDNFKIDKKSHRIYKSRDCFSFDFGGIAKGYISQKVSNLLKSLGFNRHLIDAGGDLVLGDAPPGSKGWKIKIEDSHQTLILKNTSIATSGRTYQHYEDQSLYDIHIINPFKSLNSGNNKKSVTVISKNAMKADWMATWKFITASDKAVYRY
jgi:thiamine biosynthesis lipoprotein